MNWNQMTSQQQYNTLRAMKNGGSFVASLAEAWSKADSTNANKLGAAFPEIVQRYGPGTMFYPQEAA